MNDWFWAGAPIDDRLGGGGVGPDTPLRKVGGGTPPYHLDMSDVLVIKACPPPGVCTKPGAKGAGKIFGPFLIPS